MISLGIEGTAHTLGIAVVEEVNGKCKVLSNEARMYRPK